MQLIENHIENLKNLCDKYHVDKMYLFGSALNSNFNSKSDIDFLVKFKPIDLPLFEVCNFEAFYNVPKEVKNTIVVYNPDKADLKSVPSALRSL